MTRTDFARRLILCGTLTLMTLSIAVAVQAQVTVTYVSNAGFLVEGGGKKVLIDALYDEGIIGYPVIPKDMKKKLRDAEPPFDNVDLVLLTHTHMDHFGPRTVTRHLRANPKAIMVTTPDAVAELERHVKNHEGVRERIVAEFPEEGQSIKGTYGGIELQIFNLHHGRSHRESIQNLGFLMNLGGMTVLHVGDTEARSGVFEALNFKDLKVDVALLPAWFVSYEHWAVVVREQIRPDHIVAMHMPLRDAPGNYFGLHGNYDTRADTILHMFPDSELAETPGDTFTFEPKSSD